jgi:FkbM family methyltransferase
MNAVRHAHAFPLRLRTASNQEPIMKCCVVIPVGPGHAILAERACASVYQAMSKGMGAFSAVEVLCWDDNAGQGRSRARNLAVRQAVAEGADWIFFLDADDLLDERAFEQVADYLEHHDAIWGAIHECSPDGHGRHCRPNQVMPIHRIEDILRNDPFLTLQMGHFVKARIALDNPFDENMDCGEDFKYYLQLWRQYTCLKLDQPLFFNIRGQHSTGPRSASGQDWRWMVHDVFAQFCKQNDVIVDIDFAGRHAKFQLSNTLDHIQNYLANETFFETRELIETLYVLPQKPRIMDVGSNIGNHAIFWSCIADAARVDCFEPVKSNAIQLHRNFEINGIEPSRYQVHELGMGDRPCAAALENYDIANQGASRLSLAEQGAIRIDTLDNQVPGAPVDLLKIDVEGMELEVLEGGRQLILQHRPLILIEVSNVNKGRFFSWMADSGYRVHRSFELVHASNYLLCPIVERPDFYRNGTVATRQWQPKTTLAPQQAACGWSLTDFIQAQAQGRKVLELQGDIRAGWRMVDTASGRVLQQGRRLRDILRCLDADAGDCLLLAEVLQTLESDTLQQLWAEMPASQVWLQGIMDSRWSRTFEDGHVYRDSEAYIQQANMNGLRLVKYLKTPHKSAFGMDDQLSNESSFLVFAR